MFCPMRVNHYGNTQPCEAEHCAWWDDEQNQCCIKTIALKKPEDPIQKIVDQSYNKDTWVDSFIRSELK